jgi:hypothetical protein
VQAGAWENGVFTQTDQEPEASTDTGGAAPAASQN